jgi:hypothetical protein
VALAGPTSVRPRPSRQYGHRLVVLRIDRRCFPDSLSRRRLLDGLAGRLGPAPRTENRRAELRTELADLLVARMQAVVSREGVPAKGVISYVSADIRPTHCLANFLPHSSDGHSYGRSRVSVGDLSVHCTAKTERMTHGCVHGAACLRIVSVPITRRENGGCARSSFLKVL